MIENKNQEILNKRIMKKLKKFVLFFSIPGFEVELI